MDIKVLYIGDDEGYWGKIQKRFTHDYPETNFSFLRFPMVESKPYKYFIETYRAEPQIVYLDFSEDFDGMLKLSKLLNRNNETRLYALVGLFSSTQEFKCMQRAISASVRLLHKKSDEFQDVTYDPISLIDVNMAEMPTYVQGKTIKGFEAYQTLRIGYIENNYFHVETNSHLKEGEIVEIDQHPLQHIMPSKKVYVQKYKERDLYYNRRFSYELEFIYVDNDYFSCTNENWKLFKKLKEDDTYLEKLDPIKREEVIYDMEHRKKIYGPIRSAIDEWIDEKSIESKPKQLKTMIIDDTLTLMKEVIDNNAYFPYALNFQTVLLGDYYQIPRSMPHLIVINQSERNSEEVIHSIINKVKNIEEYEPFIIVCSSDLNQEEVRRKTLYQKILCYKGIVSIENLKAMALKIEPTMAKVDSKRIYFRSENDNSTMYLKCDFEVVSFSESVLYLKSNIEIPMWTVFVVKKPISVLITVVPHKEGSEYQNEENVYRCLINGTGEIEKAQVRQLVNSSIGEELKEEEKNG